MEENIEKSDVLLHFDFVQVSGALIKATKKSIIADYRDEDRPIDLLITAPGIHDIEAGREPEEIIKDIAGTKRMVESWNKSNTVGLGNVPYGTCVSKILNPTSYHEDHTPNDEYSPKNQENKCCHLQTK